MHAEQHRQAQIAIRAATLRQVLAVWPAFDIKDIDRSWEQVQAALTAIIWLRHRQSAEVAGTYFARARRAAGAAGTAAVVLAGAPSVEYLDRVLGYVGLIVPKKLVALGRQDARAQTLVHVTGSVGRLVLNGGRDTLTQSVQADPSRPGWQRVTGGRACDFCSFLADRGAVYGEASADFAAHDHCSCSAEPVWGGEGRTVREFTPSARRFTPEQQQIRNERLRGAIADA